MIEGPEGELVTEALNQLARELPLQRTERGGVPFGPVHVVDRDERRLAPHRQANVARFEDLVDLMAERFDDGPLLVGVRLRHARVFVDSRDGHFEIERRLALFDASGDRRGRGRVGRGGERNVPFAGEQARRGVEPDPTGAGEIHFGPGMQIGEVDFRPRRTVERLLVGLELNEVTADEPRGEADVAQRLHEQPGRIAARTASAAERLFARLHARLHADDVLDAAMDDAVDFDQEVDGPLLLARDRREELGEVRADRIERQIRTKLIGELRIVGERRLFGRRLQEEVERVDDRQLGD